MWDRAKALALGGALGLVLAASSAGAQQYGAPAGPGYYNYGPPEEVIVTPPPYARQRSAIGAPIIDASISRPVRYDDLDLRSGWGVRELRDRVSFTARTLCSQLEGSVNLAGLAGLGAGRPIVRVALEPALAGSSDAITSSSLAKSSRPP